MNKVAFITGAGGYIGGETAVTLAKQGIKIAVCDINTETIEKTVKRIEEIGGVAKGYFFDVTDSQIILLYHGQCFLRSHVKGVGAWCKLPQCVSIEITKRHFQSIQFNDGRILNPIVDCIVVKTLLYNKGILFIKIQSLERGQGIGLRSKVDGELVGSKSLILEQILGTHLLLECSEQQIIGKIAGIRYINDGIDSE